MFYRCKSCGGNVVYRPDVGKMVCESCGMEEAQQLVPQERDHVCNNCGAKIERTDNSLALRCPYCGTYVIFEDRMEGEREPKLVLPFQIEKNRAAEHLKRNFEDRLFLPPDFCSAASLEKMEGRYVPFWMYDLHAHVRFVGEGDRIRTWSDGDYEYKETKTYRLVRDFDVDYDKVPVDASREMPDRLMDLIEPYQYEALGAFRAECLSGFFAQVYDEDKETLYPRAKGKADTYNQGYLNQYNVGYDIVRPFENSSQIREREAFYAFLPMWRYVYRYGGKDYEFFVNGQTGKTVGEAPISRLRAAACTAAAAAVLFFFLEMLLYFLEVL